MEEDNVRPTETTRLLDEARPTSRSSTKPSMTPLQCILAAATIQLLLDVGSSIALVPQTAILQEIVCDNYYSHIDQGNGTTYSGPGRCKVEPVQSEVAYINGWQAAIENIATMLLAVPFGALADRIGRKKVFIMAIIGLIMNDTWIRLVFWFTNIFPIRAVLFAGLWEAIGAGSASLSSLTYVLVADACPAEQRTIAFSQISFARFLSKIICVPLGGMLMSLSPWVPMWISSVFMIIGLVAAFILIPETLAPSASLKNQDAYTPLLQSETGSQPRTVSQRLRHGIAKVSMTAGWLWTTPGLISLMFSFLTYSLGEPAVQTLFLQYVSKRLGWSFSKASFLLSLRSGVHMVVLSVIIPASSLLLIERFRVHNMTKDKLIAQASGVFLVLGSATIFLSTSPPAMIFGQLLSSLGDCFGLPVRSLVTSMVEKHHLGTLYMLIEVVSRVGLITSQALMPVAFRFGMKMGSFWIGLPFLISAGCFLLAVLAVSTVRVKDNQVGDITSNEE